LLQILFFSNTYSNLDNKNFVALIYQNVLGQAGDSAGLSFWEGALNNGQSRGDMIVDFVRGALTFNINDPIFNTLSTAELQTALERQALIENKVEASLYFSNTLENNTNITTTTLENDDAYLASIKVLDGITNTASTLSTAKTLINNANATSDAIHYINVITSRSRQENNQAADIDIEGINNYVDSDLLF